MRFRSARDAALLVELAGPDEVMVLGGSLCAEPLRSVGGPVPGANRLLVPFDPWTTTAHEVAEALLARPVTGVRRVRGRELEIPTVYDGATRPHGSSWASSGSLRGSRT